MSTVLTSKQPTCKVIAVDIGRHEISHGYTSSLASLFDRLALCLDVTRGDRNGRARARNAARRRRGERPLPRREYQGPERAAPAHREQRLERAPGRRVSGLRSDPA